MLNPLNKLVGIGVQEHAEYDFIVLILLTERLMIEGEA